MILPISDVARDALTRAWPGVNIGRCEFGPLGNEEYTELRLRAVGSLAALMAAGVCPTGLDLPPCGVVTQPRRTYQRRRDGLIRATLYMIDPPGSDPEARLLDAVTAALAPAIWQPPATLNEGG